MAAARLNPKQVYDWRRSMKLSIDQFTAFTGAAAGRTIRRWEDGTRDIPEYLDILYELSASPSIRDWMIERAMKEWNRRCDADLAAGGEPSNES